MELELSRIFVKVVQYASFTKAAESLKIPKSTVSKSISRLERETGTKLLIRSTRNVTATQAGRTFYEASIGPLAELEDAQKALQGSDSLLTGTVRITAPEDLGTFLIAPAIAKLSIRHPRLRFELRYTDTVIDLIQEGFDLAIRLGNINDSGLKLKRAGEVSLFTVASPAYLEGKTKIKAPRDLSEHSCLTLGLDELAKSWNLRSKERTVRVPIQARVTSNQMSSLVQLALSGAGIALVPSYICAPYLKRGELVRVLPEWRNAGWPISILSPLAPSASARLKVTVEQITADLRAGTQ
jgi:DNA-binding transcriptional LysR family regulator